MALLRNLAILGALAALTIWYLIEINPNSQLSSQVRDWFNAPQDSSSKPQLPPMLADEPDIYLDDSVMAEFSTTGALKFELAATQMRHFEEGNNTQLLAPKLDLYSETSLPWNIVAERGVIQRLQEADGPTQEVVDLEGSVVMRQIKGDTSQLIIRGTEFRIYPERQYAESNQNVMIDSNVGRTRAASLKGDLANGLLHLSSGPNQRVNTIVLPQQFKASQTPNEPNETSTP